MQQHLARSPKPETSIQQNELKCSESSDRRSSRSRPAKQRKTARDRISGRVNVKEISGPSLIENVSCDVLFEIMGYLYPQDMLSLSRTNRTFRNYLMSRNAQHLWRRAREVIGAPAPLSGCSEPRWADLIFGTSCQVCETIGAHKVHFGLCRKICRNCQKSNLVLRSKFKDRCPDYDTTILDLIPYTTVGKSKLYWLGDIHTIHERLTAFYVDVDLQKRDAKAALDTFKEERAKTTSKVQESVPALDLWISNYKRTKQQERREMEERRKQEIIRNFVQMGHKERDIEEALFGVKFPANDKEMTSGVWTKVKQRYQPLIISAREERLRPLLAMALKSTLERWMKTLRPNQWARLPPLSVIRRHPTIEEILLNDEEVENLNTVAGFSDLTGKFGEISFQWQAELTSLFDAMVGVAIENNAEESFPVPKILGVVYCTHCKEFIFGLDEWAEHAWMENGWTRSFYSEPCFDPTDRLRTCSISLLHTRSLSNLLTLLGKDPHTTTPFDLDLSGERFYCSCDDLPVKTAYTWRQSVHHSFQTFGVHSPRLVTNFDELEQIRRQEQLTICAEDWLCVHCSEFYQSPKPLSTVREHLLETHAIQEPKEQQDFMWDFTRPRRDSRIYMYIHVQPPEDSEDAWSNDHSSTPNPDDFEHDLEWRKLPELDWSFLTIHPAEQ